MYRDIPMSQRLDRIGEILAKGVYLYANKEKLKAKAGPKPEPAIRLPNRVKEKAGKIT